MIVPVLFLLLGVICGKFLFSAGMMSQVDICVTVSLAVVVFTAGVGVGAKREIFKKLREYRAKILLIPLGTIIGTVFGGVLLGLLLGIPLNEAAAVSAGFGYYSLSAGILTSLGGAGLGALAFVSNIFREVLSFIAIPLAAKRNPYCAIAPGGATSMDTTLGAVSRCTNEEITMLSMIHGVVLTIVVPVLVPFLYEFLK